MFQVNRLHPDPYWHTRTTNQRDLRKWRLTSPIFLTMLDQLPYGYREILHALTKDIFDHFQELDREVDITMEDYDVFSVVDIYKHCFLKMDLSWEGLPTSFVKFVQDHL